MGLQGLLRMSVDGHCARDNARAVMIQRQCRVIRPFIACGGGKTIMQACLPPSVGLHMVLRCKQRLRAKPVFEVGRLLCGQHQMAGLA